MVRRLWSSPFGEDARVGFSLLALGAVATLFWAQILPLGVVQ